MRGIRSEEPISAICRGEGIPSNMYYQWLERFMEAGQEQVRGNETRGATRSEVEQY